MSGASARRRREEQGRHYPVALLAAAAAARQLGDLRPHLVRPRAGRADRGLLHQGGMEARLSRDQRVRAHADRRRRAHRQAARPCQRRGAEEAHDRAAGASPHKRYKVGLEDFRNIAKRKQYLEAYDDMLEQTDTDHAPWHVIASRRQAARPARRPQDHRRGTGPRRRRSPSRSSIPRSPRPPSSCGAGSRTTEDEERQEELNASSTMVRVSPNYWTWPAGHRTLASAS